MKFFVTLSKRQLAVVLATLIILLLTLGQIASAKAGEKIGNTNALRVDYIKSLRLTPDDSKASFKNITLPQKFCETYKEYNRLQKKAGFNLEYYKGKSATVYSYPVSGDERQVHLIVCDDKIIGGDISDININGKMSPLLRQK